MTMMTVRHHNNVICTYYYYYYPSLLYTHIVYIISTMFFDNICCLPICFSASFFTYNTTRHTLAEHTLFERSCWDI